MASKVRFSCTSKKESHVSTTKQLFVFIYGFIYCVTSITVMLTSTTIKDGPKSTQTGAVNGPPCRKQPSSASVCMQHFPLISKFHAGKATLTPGLVLWCPASYINNCDVSAKWNPKNPNKQTKKTLRAAACSVWSLLLLQQRWNTFNYFKKNPKQNIVFYF